MNNTEDRRVRRTKKLLADALLRLLKKKNIQRISVKELAEEADITRATFYQHYNDPCEILTELQEDIKDHIQQIIEETTGGDAFGFFIQLFTYLADDSVQPEILSYDAGHGSGYEQIGNSIHNNYMLRWGQKFSPSQMKQYEYYRYYIVFGCIAVVENWVDHGKKESPEEMARITFSVLPKEKMFLKSDKK